MSKKKFNLKQISDFLDGDLNGKEDSTVSGVSSLNLADRDDISFIYSKKFVEQLKVTQAKAVVLEKEFSDFCSVDSIVVDNAHLAYAKLTQLFKKELKKSGITSSAFIETKKIDPSSYIGPNVIIEKGAKIGKWDTMVEALSISTIGLGGDSQVSFAKNPNEGLFLGPKRHVPLSIKALEHPIIIETLKKQSNFPINNPTDGLFVWKKKVKQFPDWLSKIEKSSFERLFENKPLPLSDIAPNQASLGAIDRLINYNLVEVSGFTPTDAAHVLGAYDKFSKEASILGAIIITKQKNGSGKFIASSKEELSEMVLKSLFKQSSVAIFDFALNEQFQDQEKKVFLKNKIFQD